MEFRYKRVKPLRTIFFTIYFIASFALIGWLFNYAIPDFKRDIPLIATYFLPIFIVYFGVKIRLYYKYRKSVVKIDDQAVSITDVDGFKQEIPWEEVTEVLIRGTDLSKGASKIKLTPYVIIVKGKSGEIEISQSFEGFPVIVQTLKNRFGERFDTFELPLEMKNPRVR